nr:carboxylesterase family protein [Streptacidiphilus sp. PB12-B1b]
MSYAAAPFGVRRFAKPEPAEHWAGERDATSFGPRATTSTVPNNAVTASTSTSSIPSKTQFS